MHLFQAAVGWHGEAPFELSKGLSWAADGAVEGFFRSVICTLIALEFLIGAIHEQLSPLSRGSGDTRARSTIDSCPCCLSLRFCDFGSVISPCCSCPCYLFLRFCDLGSVISPCCSCPCYLFLRFCDLGSITRPCCSNPCYLFLRFCDFGSVISPCCSCPCYLFL